MTDTADQTGQSETEDATAPSLSNEQCLSIISQMLERCSAVPAEHRLAQAALQTLARRMTDG